MPVSPARTKHWTRAEYERLVGLGAFAAEERLELIGGRLVVREPERRPHATGIRLAAALRAAFGPGWTIEAPLPIALDEESEPEPDVAVLAGGPRDHPAAPTTPVAAADLRP
jgi:Uma2 family endonuclease